MTDVGWADLTRVPSGGWQVTLYTPTYFGSGRYKRTEGPVTSTAAGFEGANEWLRKQGYDATAYKPGALGGFRVELRKL